MSRMLLGLHLHVWILAITPLFFAAFTALVFWLFRKNSRDHYASLSKMPMDH